MVGRHPYGRVISGKLDQPADDLIDAVEIFIDPVAVQLGLFRVVARVRFVEDVPQLVLYAVGPPEVLEEGVPAVTGHQVLGDLCLVLKLVV